MFAPKPRLNVRPPAVAGSFYPHGTGELKATVAALMSQVEPSVQRPLLGVIAPHAGYTFSGPVAASAFAEVAAAGYGFTRVLLIGPPHYLPVSGIAAPSAKFFATPLGQVATDADAIASLVEAGLVSIDDMAHAPEHSLEVELPFLQTLLGPFAVVPLLAGDAIPQQAAAVLRRLWGGPETLFVVSSDLSHYHDYDTARRLDGGTATAIERGNWELEALCEIIRALPVVVGDVRWRDT